MGILSGGMSYKPGLKDPTALEDSAGKAVVATTEPHLSLIPLTDPSTSVDQGNCGRVFRNSTS